MSSDNNETRHVQIAVADPTPLGLFGTFRGDVCCIHAEAQNQFPAGHQPVYVIAMSDSHRPILSAKMAWPQVRSRGVVIFKLSSLPRVR